MFDQNKRSKSLYDDQDDELSENDLFNLIDSMYEERNEDE